MTDSTQDTKPDPGADPTPPRRTPQSGPVQYRGEDLEPERGPGLGCFRFQLAVLAVFIVLTPLSVAWGWPEAVSAVLLFSVLVLLLFTGQTVIFLLRLVAADRRGRRRPLASETRTVGELEDGAIDEPHDTAVGAPDDVPVGAPDDVPVGAPESSSSPAGESPDHEGPVRQ